MSVCTVWPVAFGEQDVESGPAGPVPQPMGRRQSERHKQESSALQCDSVTAPGVQTPEGDFVFPRKPPWAPRRVT